MLRGSAHAFGVRNVRRGWERRPEDGSRTLLDSSACLLHRRGPRRARHRVVISHAASPGVGGLHVRFRHYLPTRTIHRLCIPIQRYIGSKPWCLISISMLIALLGYILLQILVYFSCNFLCVYPTMSMLKLYLTTICLLVASYISCICRYKYNWCCDELYSCKTQKDQGRTKPTSQCASC